MMDNVEIRDPFLGSDATYDLSPFNISFRDYHYYFIGRYLAQLHCSGMLMRDVSPANILFRLSDGYPVLCDDPIMNIWGEKATVFASDLFVPAISFNKSRF